MIAVPTTITAGNNGLVSLTFEYHRQKFIARDALPSKQLLNSPVGKEDVVDEAKLTSKVQKIDNGIKAQKKSDEYSRCKIAADLWQAIVRKIFSR